MIIGHLFNNQILFTICYILGTLLGPGGITKMWGDEIYRQIFIVHCDRNYIGDIVAVIFILPSTQFKLGNTVTQWGGENSISETLVCR